MPAGTLECVAEVMRSLLRVLTYRQRLPGRVGLGNACGLLVAPQHVRSAMAAALQYCACKASEAAAAASAAAFGCALNNWPHVFRPLCRWGGCSQQNLLELSDN